MCRYIYIYIHVYIIVYIYDIYIYIYTCENMMVLVGFIIAFWSS